MLQPSYLPWLGFFDLLHQASIFVVYDDVQYTRRDWRNRNRIKTPQGPLWLTVPVLNKGKFDQLVSEATIDPSARWADKHLASFHASYARAPHYARARERLASVLEQRFERLLDLNLALIRALAKELGIERRIVLSSELGVPGRKTQRLVDICRALEATEYLSGPAAKSYIEDDAFAAAGIALRYHAYHHPTYSQLWGDFVSHLSVIDLLANHGPESLEIITRPTVSLPPGADGSSAYMSGE